MRCLVTAGKHFNYTRDIARQPPMTTIERLLQSVFSAGFASAECSEPRLEAGSNYTSTVALRVVDGDEKGSQCLGV
jgi:hypothetical protein